MHLAVYKQHAEDSSTDIIVLVLRRRELPNDPPGRRWHKLQLHLQQCEHLHIRQRLFPANLPKPVCELPFPYRNCTCSWQMSGLCLRMK